jgi:flagellin
MDVNLSKAVRSNLLSLQSTAESMAKTQNRLATGLKVNSALDNPSNFFTASALNSRASDMANLLDSMSSGIKTIEAADNGLKSITKTVESMQSTLRQARQDKSNKTTSFALDATAIGTTSVKTLSLSGGAVGTTPVSVDLNTIDEVATPATTTGTGGFTNTGTTINAAALGTFTIQTSDLNGGSALTIDLSGLTAGTDDATSVAAEINSQLDAATGGDGGITASASGGQLVFTDADGTNITLGGTGTVLADLGLSAGTSTDGVEAVTGAVKTVDALVTEINNNTSINSAVRASNDNGKLRIENISTSDLTVTGVGTDGEVDGTSSTATIGGNDVRANLAKQFNELRDQLDKFADDASFNGINLLRGDKLKLTFNETGTSTIEIQAKDEDGVATSINNTALGIDAVTDADFDSDAGIDAKLDVLKSSLDSLRSQSSTFGSNLSVVENRQDFTKNMINTLETGAANLTLADTNEEAANLLALQTRQQLSSTALSMASQADQAVLRLF